MAVTVQVKVVPSSGAATQREVAVEPGARVGQVLKAAGLSADGMQITVDGEPATHNTYTGPGAVITLTEKVRGS